MSEENLARAKQLAEQIEKGNRDAVLQLVADIASARDDDLFQHVGKLTRSLHDTVRSIGTESPNSLFDANKFPDARERLNHVIKLTGESANTTLTIIENSIPIVEQSRQSAAELLKRWKKLCKKELPLEKFKDLSNDIQAYLNNTQKVADDLQSELTKVLMVQGFQDLTGQMIKQVINLVDDVEERLIELVTLGGGIAEPDSEQKKIDDRQAMLKGEGPALPSKTDGVVQSQDDVDDLLASLGF